MAAHLSKIEGKPLHPDPRSVLAWNVRRLRVARGWSQEQLGFESGLDRTYVSALEREVWNVSLSNIEKLAHSLAVEPWQLLHP